MDAKKLSTDYAGRMSPWWTAVQVRPLCSTYQDGNLRARHASSAHHGLS